MPSVKVEDIYKRYMTASTAAVPALVALYKNQLKNMDLEESDLHSRIGKISMYVEEHFHVEKEEVKKYASDPNKLFFGADVAQVFFLDRVHGLLLWAQREGIVDPTHPQPSEGRFEAQVTVRQVDTENAEEARSMEVETQSHQSVASFLLGSFLQDGNHDMHSVRSVSDSTWNSTNDIAGSTPSGLCKFIKNRCHAWIPAKNMFKHLRRVCQAHRNLTGRDALVVTDEEVVQILLEWEEYDPIGAWEAFNIPFVALKGRAIHVALEDLVGCGSSETGRLLRHIHGNRYNQGVVAKYNDGDWHGAGRLALLAVPSLRPFVRYFFWTQERYVTLLPGDGFRFVTEVSVALPESQTKVEAPDSQTKVEAVIDCTEDYTAALDDNDPRLKHKIIVIRTDKGLAFCSKEYSVKDVTVRCGDPLASRELIRDELIRYRKGAIKGVIAGFHLDYASQLFLDDERYDHHFLRWPGVYSLAAYTGPAKGNVQQVCVSSKYLDGEEGLTRPSDPWIATDECIHDLK